MDPQSEAQGTIPPGGPRLARTPVQAVRSGAGTPLSRAAHSVRSVLAGPTPSSHRLAHASTAADADEWEALQPPPATYPEPDHTAGELCKTAVRRAALLPCLAACPRAPRPPALLLTPGQGSQPTRAGGASAASRRASWLTGCAPLAPHPAGFIPGGPKLARTPLTRTPGMPRMPGSATAQHQPGYTGGGYTGGVPPGSALALRFPGSAMALRYPGSAAAAHRMGYAGGMTPMAAGPLPMTFQVRRRPAGDARERSAHAVQHWAARERDCGRCWSRDASLPFLPPFPPPSPGLCQASGSAVPGCAAPRSIHQLRRPAAQPGAGHAAGEPCLAFTRLALSLLAPGLVSACLAWPLLASPGLAFCSVPVSGA